MGVSLGKSKGKIHSIEYRGYNGKWDWLVSQVGVGYWVSER